VEVVVRVSVVVSALVEVVAAMTLVDEVDGVLLVVEIDDSVTVFVTGPAFGVVQTFGF